MTKLIETFAEKAFRDLESLKEEYKQITKTDKCQPNKIEILIKDTHSVGGLISNNFSLVDFPGIEGYPNAIQQMEEVSHRMIPILLIDLVAESIPRKDKIFSLLKKSRLPPVIVFVNVLAILTKVKQKVLEDYS